jgi:hypothetical protein
MAFGRSQTGLGRKGEGLLLGLFGLLIISSMVIFYQGSIQDKAFLGDTNAMVVYNLRSQSANCSILNISIKNEHIKLFSTAEEAKTAGYNLSDNCS